MTASWLVPSAAALAALVVLPVLAHLTRRAPTDRVAFGAMLLIDRLVRRLRRRRSLKDPWLLLIRALAIVAAALAATGPFVAWQELDRAYAGNGRVVVVLDRSMSMSMAHGEGTLLARARDEAIAFVEALPGGAQVALVVCGSGPEVRTDGLSADLEGVAALIGAVEAGPAGCDLRASLLEARKLLDGDPGDVLIFTDEAGPVMIPAAAEEIERLIAQGSNVLPRPVHAEPPRNVAVLGAVYGDGLEGGQVTLRAANYGPEPVEVACEVVLPDGASIPVFMQLPADGEAEARVTVPRKADGGVALARCDDPSLPGDDRRYFHLPSIGASRVVVVDGDPGDSPLKSEVYFLERALAPWGGEQAGVVPDVVSASGLLASDLSAYKVVFLANVSDPRPFAAELREFVRRGGSLVVAGGENVTSERYNEAIGPILPGLLRPTRSLADLAEEPVRLVAPDTDHPLFEPFKRAGRSGFSRAGAWRVLTLEPFAESDSTQTLLRYEGGVPALIDHTVGSGHVILWTSTFDLGWSNLPLQAVFMPMVQRLVTVLGGDAGGRAARRDAVVGERVEVEVPDGAAVVVTDADGQPARSQIEGARVVLQPEAPGGLQVRLEGGPVLAWIAVNAEVSESDVRRSSSLASAQKAVDPEAFERRLELGPGLLAAALAAMMVSAWIGLRGTA